MSEKIRDLWEQRKLLLKANYLDVKLNFLCERKPVNENSGGMDAHLILFGTRLHTNKPILIAWISIVFILGRNRFYYSKTDCLGWDLERRRISLDTYDFECKNILCRIGRSYLQEQSSPLIFLETLWSCHGESRKWKFEKIVTLFRGRMTEKNVYHTKYADWYRQSVAAYHSPFATLYWVSNKVALKVVCKGVWCLYNRRNSTWLLVDIATSLRRKGIFMIASVLH